MLILTLAKLSLWIILQKVIVSLMFHCIISSLLSRSSLGSHRTFCHIEATVYVCAYIKGKLELDDLAWYWKPARPERQISALQHFPWRNLSYCRFKPEGKRVLHLEHGRISHFLEEAKPWLLLKSNSQKIFFTNFFRNVIEFHVTLS